MTSKDEWEAHIHRLRSEIALDSDRDVATTGKELWSLIERTIISMAKRGLETGSLGLLFSGGIDSTIIAFVLKKHSIPFKAVSIGFQDNPSQKYPDDLASAEKVADSLGFDFTPVVYDFRQIESLFEETARALGKSLINAVNIGVGSVELAGLKSLKKLDPSITHVFGGIGSEEIFAGYKRHADATDAHDECWNGLELMYERDLLRELALSHHVGVDLLVPFLDEDVIRYAMTIPESLKISHGSSKIILREAAFAHGGLDMTFSRRPKKAAQYGSRTHHALEKLSSKKGFGSINEYISSFLH